MHSKVTTGIQKAVSGGALKKETRIFVNHVGFTPKGGKYFVVMNPHEENFQITRRWGEQVLFRGQLKRVSKDLGAAWVGNFTKLRKEGSYLIHCGKAQSRVVTIYKGIYDYPLRVIFNYFPSQRCGNSFSGWHAPCHTADGRLADTGKHVDVTGGWHQSCDLRKWTHGVSFGPMGLTQFGLRKSPRWDRGQIAEEIRWGNQFFHKMARPDGGLMAHVVEPGGWAEERDICPKDACSLAIYNTIIGQAMAAEFFKDSDPRYSRKCLEIARHMWRYITGENYSAARDTLGQETHDWMSMFFSQNYPGSALNSGDGLYAALAMYRATGENEWLDTACSSASALVNLQIGGNVSKDPVSACFRIGHDRPELECAYYDGYLGQMGLCELLQLRPDHKDAIKWRKAIYRIAEQNCMMAERNPWGLIPCYWYAQDPGGGRKAGSGYYRYFYNYDRLSAGLNADILGSALFLLRVHKITSKQRYFDIACRQLDWILGCNPFNASTVEGVGNNQPQRLISDQFSPPTPQIPGAVMTGIVGTDKDEPLEFGIRGPGRINVDVEYNIPQTAMLMWLMSELPE
ncbi:MAG: glycoside hydrolase family 9 protein [Kiritimatiellia bacterium]|nr:glycoside hydrolase family 9 protein [Kiritimatiellia bacterium]